MPKSKSRSRVAVLEKHEQPPQAAPASAAPEAIWAVALLRVAMELRRANAPSYDEIVRGVVERMGLDEGPFRAFLKEKIGDVSELR